MQAWADKALWFGFYDLERIAFRIALGWGAEPWGFWRVEGFVMMIEGLLPYGEYKDSGLRSIGSVPRHWNIHRAKTLFREIDSRSSTGKEELLSVSHISGVRKRSELNATMFLAKSNQGHKLCQANDLIINTMWAWMGALGVSSCSGLVSPAYGVYRLHSTERLLPMYMHHILRTPAYVAEYTSRSSGIHSSRLRLYPEQFLRIPLIIPPPSEQAAIVRFLDHANRRIDRYIRAKRKLIALLNEQKQAIIHRAVTRGLDPNVPMKDSGVAWLGEIPAHWEVLRIKNVLREVDHRSTTGKEALLSMRMHHGIVPFAEHFTRAPQAATLVGFKVVKPGQFVINRMQAGNGVIFPSKLHGLVSPDYAVFDPICDVNVDLLGELFRSPKVRIKFRAESKGLGTGSSGFLRLYNDRLGAIHIALPSRAEQDSILQGLAEQLKELIASISRAERQIALMREYRTRLTADIVTGQLDVRNAVQNLPPDAQDSTPVPDDAQDELHEDEGEIDEGEMAE